MSKKQKIDFSGKCDKAVIFARVSSKEQELGDSINAQIAATKAYCNKHDLSVIKTFSITESSTKGGRKQFYEMIDFVKKQQSKIAIVVNCVDRLQRSSNESPILDELRKEGRIEIHFLRENLLIHKDSKSSEIMIWDIFVMLAKAYVANLTDNVKRSMDFNWKNGKWQGYAAIGYLNSKDELGKACIVIDPERAPLVKRLFEEYATGKHSLQTIEDFANEINLRVKPRPKFPNPHPVRKNEIYKILTNPFYMGVMKINDKLIPHIYEKLIDKTLFDSVQDILEGKSRPPFKSGYGELPYAFRGLVRCSTCGCVMSPETKTKKNGKQYNYLKCGHHKGHCNQKPVNEMYLFDQLDREVFDHIKISESMLDKIKKDVCDYIKKESAQDTGTKKSVESRISENKATKDRLLDLYIKGKIDEPTYNNKNANLEAEKIELLDMRAKFGDVEVDIKEIAENVLEIAANAGTIIKSSDPLQQRALLGLLLSDCYIEGRTLKFTLQKPFDSFIKAKGSKSWLDAACEFKTSDYNDIIDVSRRIQLFKNFHSDSAKGLEI